MMDEKSKWQPIETAPKDGTKIIMASWNEDHSISSILVGILEPPTSTQGDITRARAIFGFGTIVYPSHWMPLPEPPK